MGFNQTHILSAVLRAEYAGWSVSLIGNYYTGTPYTPSFRRAEAVGSTATSALQENSQYKPSQKCVDLYIAKQFRISRMRIGLSVGF